MEMVLESVTKRFGRVAALDDVSLTIAPGQVVAVLGPNGAGKTTLLRCLAGIAALDRGEIRYDGQRFQREQLDMRRRFGFLPDFPFVYMGMTVLRHIGMVLQLYEADGVGVEETVIELLQDFDLLPLADVKLGTLSRGQTYKAALCALLAADPEVWLLDEPFASGMDPRGLSAFKRRARAAIERGRTILYTTQILDVVEGFSDRVCIIHRGKVRAFDSASRLRGAGSGAAGSVLEEVFEYLREEVP